MGSRLALSRIMHTGFLLECGPETPIAEAASLMTRHGVSSILVRSGAEIVGIWTEHDALAVDFSDPEHFRTPIREVMSSPVLTLPATMDVNEAATRLRESGKRHALVIDQDGEPAGIVSQTDLALNQGLEPYLRLREVRAVIPGIPLVISGSHSISEVALQMRHHHADAVVIDCGDRGLGIITERDMVRLIANHTTDTPAAEVASRPLLVIHEDAPLIRARDLLLEHRIRHLAVVDDQHQVTGLIGFRDMLAGAEHLYLEDLRQALEQRDRALAKSRNSLRLAERVIESSYEGIMITDRQARIEFVNPAFTFLTGYEQQEVVGKTPAILSSGRHDREFYRRMWETVAEHGFWRGEIWNRRKNGELFLERLTITAITDDQGEVTHYAGLFTDITQS